MFYEEMRKMKEVVIMVQAAITIDMITWFRATAGKKQRQKSFTKCAHSLQGTYSPLGNALWKKMKEVVIIAQAAITIDMIT